MDVSVRISEGPWQGNALANHASPGEASSTPSSKKRGSSTEDLSASAEGSSFRQGDTSSSAPSQGDFFGGSSNASAYGAGQSLTTVLNNPRLGKSGVYGNDATWSQWIAQAQRNGEPVPDGPPPLPESIADVGMSEFMPYLSQIADPYKKYFDVSRHAMQEHSKVGFSSVDYVEGQSTVHDASGGELPQSSPSIKQRSLSRGEGLSACLSEVPPIYFDEDFALDRKETFQAVCPNSSIPSSMLLQEKLSHYLDLVEVHLVKEISSRSESFFEALEQLEELNGQIVDTCSQIGQLRFSVGLLDGDLLEGARKLQLARVRRENLLSLYNKLKLVDFVNQALATMKFLVSSNDCSGALEVIDDLYKLAMGDDLKGLHCFRNISDSLASATESVNAVLTAEFLKVSVHSSSDVDPPTTVVASYQRRRKVGGTVALDIILALETTGAEERNSALKEQLLPVILGLLRTSKLPSVLRAYRDALNSDIKAAIKVVVGELLPVLYVKGVDGGVGPAGQTDAAAAAAAADMADGAPNLALKLRGLSGEAFVQLLLAVFEAVQSRLVRAADLRKVIEQTVGGETEDAYAAAAVAVALARGAEKVAEDQSEPKGGSVGDAKTIGGGASTRAGTGQLPSSNASAAGGPTTTAGIAASTSKQLRAEVLRENAEAVADACDVAHGRWGKLLGVRAQQHARLSLTDFVDFYTLTSHFIAATERVGGRLGYSIRGALQSQAKAFVDTFHATKVARLNGLLDKELWAAVDAPPEAQKLVNFFEKEASECSPESPNGKVSANGTGPEADESKKGEGKGEADEAKAGAAKKAIKTLLCHGESYHVCNSLLEVLSMTREYITVSESLPMLAGEVVHRLSEILKLFNSRTCQLVLGAGAMQVSGLKSITAKHLALSSQCISLVYALLPDIRRILASHVPDARRAIVMSQLERVSQDFRVHRDEIHSKLVAIMRERLLVHLRSLPAVIEGYAKPEDPEGNASNFARALTKEVGVLHRILAPLLLEADLRSIFTRVVALFHAQLADSFSKIDTPTDTSKIKMQRDLQLILKCLRSLPTNSAPRHDHKPRELEQLLLTKFGPGAQNPSKPAQAVAAPPSALALAQGGAALAAEPETAPPSSESESCPQPTLKAEPPVPSEADAIPPSAEEAREGQEAVVAQPEAQEQQEETLEEASEPEKPEGAEVEAPRDAKQQIVSTLEATDGGQKASEVQATEDVRGEVASTRPGGPANGLADGETSEVAADEPTLGAA